MWDQRIVGWKDIRFRDNSEIKIWQSRRAWIENRIIRDGS